MGAQVYVCLSGCPSTVYCVYVSVWSTRDKQSREQAPQVKLLEVNYCV